VPVQKRLAKAQICVGVLSLGTRSHVSSRFCAVVELSLEIMSHGGDGNARTDMLVGQRHPQRRRKSQTDALSSHNHPQPCILHFPGRSDTERRPPCNLAVHFQFSSRQTPGHIPHECGEAMTSVGIAGPIAEIIRPTTYPSHVDMPLCCAPT
jgi:hypothetical protein